MRKAIFTFGRFNPPTIGHKALLDKVEHYAHKHDGDHFVFASKSHDNKKNPLPFNEKMEYLTVMFPNINFKEKDEVKDPFKAINWLVKEGYKDIIMIVGSDRVEEFERAITPYLDHKDPEKRLNLESFKVISAGDRDPDGDGIIGASSSKARQLVQDGKFEEFKQIIPIPDDMIVRTLFNRIGLGLQPVRQMSEAEKIRKLIDELSRTNLTEDEDMPTSNDINVIDYVKRYKEFSREVLEAKDPYQTLKDFDKTRTGLGKKPIFKSSTWKIEVLDPATHDWKDSGQEFLDKKKAGEWAQKNIKGRFDISLK